ncbi:MAG: hypothetical protein KUG78_07475 [Kangiellaceae bacterium]|nr:hypothetical protein [Kangiellaceae bacterium]
MKSLSECMETYQQQLQQGDIQIAYSGLMKYLTGLRNHLKAQHPDFYVSGNFYQGYLDFSYFSFTPPKLKQRRLRIAIVLIHKTLAFKVRLGGLNKTVQASYWDKVSSSGWDKYTVPESISGKDYIVESQLVESPNFNDLEKLTKQLEKGVLEFVDDIEALILEL